MRKRRNKDMYIDYSKSYLYRRRSRGSKIAGIIIVVILAFVFGIGTYYAVRIKTGGEYRLNRKHDMADNNEENSAEIIPSPVITTAPINDDTGEEEVVDESDTRTPSG